MVQDAVGRAREALRRHAPARAQASLAALGSGLDHEVLVTGELVLRVSSGGSPSREARLLGVVAERVDLAVPRPLWTDDDLGVLACTLLPGRALLGRAAPPGAGLVLGRFLRRLHGTDPAAVHGLVPVDDTPPAGWLDGLEGPPALLEVLHRSVPPPTDLRVLVHADLGAEHLLEQGGALTGVLDWSDAALADPAVDLARLLRDFGEVVLDEVVQAYGGPPDAGPWRARVLHLARCAALEDLAYGRRTGRTAYVAAAERSLARLFAVPDDGGSATPAT